MDVSYQWNIEGVEESLKRRIETTVENEIEKLEKTTDVLNAIFVKEPDKNISCICDLTNESGQLLKQYHINVSGKTNDEIVTIRSTTENH